VLANYFEGALKAINCSDPTHVIKVSRECLMRQYTNVGWISENSRIGVYRGVREKIAIGLKGAPNLIHELYKWKAMIGRIDNLWNVLNDVKCGNKVK
jgi:hypothetical protein